jgi:hypothetical protein
MVKYFLAVTIMCSAAAQADEISPARGDALKTCWTNTLKKYPWKASDLNNSAQQLRTYDGCMFEHRQPS